MTHLALQLGVSALLAEGQYLYDEAFDAGSGDGEDYLYNYETDVEYEYYDEYENPDEDPENKITHIEIIEEFNNDTNSNNVAILGRSALIPDSADQPAQENMIQARRRKKKKKRGKGIGKGKGPTPAPFQQMTQAELLSEADRSDPFYMYKGFSSLSSDDPSCKKFEESTFENQDNFFRVIDGQQKILRQFAFNYRVPGGRKIPIGGTSWPYVRISLTTLRGVKQANNRANFNKVPHLLSPFLTPRIQTDPGYRGRAYDNSYVNGVVEFYDSLSASDLSYCNDATKNYGRNNFGAQYMLVLTATSMRSPAADFQCEDNTNNFQVLLCTNFLQTFAIFNYGTMNWGFKDDEGLKQVVAGAMNFNRLTMNTYPFAGTKYSDINDLKLPIEKASNVGVKGQYVFDVSDIDFKDEPNSRKGWNYAAKTQPGTTTTVAPITEATTAQTTTATTTTTTPFRHCDSSPCQTGTCMENDNTYYCSCDESHTGKECETRIPCSDSPCNNGICLNSWNYQTFSCECNDGFTGQFCDKSIPCFSNPCKNGAKCLNSQFFDAFSCVCEPGFTGTKCDILIPCGSSPCENNGVCSNTVLFDDFVCECPAGFTGKSCEIRLPCSLSPCENGGKCFNINDARSYSCQCPANATGRNCETILPCSEKPCQNGGICSENEEEFKNGIYKIDFECACNSKTTGKFCEKVIPCSSSPCKHNATCENSDNYNDYICECPIGLTGRDCETILPCSSSPCKNGATCENSPFFDSFSCICEGDYTGTLCEISLPCATSPCKNDAVCYNTNNYNSFRCDCSQGYTGEFCDVIVPCSLDPCFNGGICENSVTYDSYTCRCGKEFEGLHCEAATTPAPTTTSTTTTTATTTTTPSYQFCDSNPCVMGSCSEDWVQEGRKISSEGYMCTCDQGWRGDDCDKPVPCFSSPCLNDAECVNHLFRDTYTCKCEENYVGDNCEQFLFCSSSPCLNNARCDNEINGFECACPDGFTGDRCEKIVPCSKNPCENQASCYNVDDFSDYICDCLDGFEGKSCGEYLACSTNPCEMGQCVNSADSFTCTCFTGYTGSVCDSEIPCSSNPCMNGGDCYDVNSYNDYICACPDGYTGANCESFLYCSRNPCLMGSCQELDDGFSCDCQESYTGQLCESLIPCERAPCLNGGTCENINDFTGYECSCGRYFEGTHCELQKTTTTQEVITEKTTPIPTEPGTTKNILEKPAEFNRVGFYASNGVTILQKLMYQGVLTAQQIQSLENYGCWCRRLNPFNKHIGGHAVDHIDLACKNWNQCKHCSQLKPYNCPQVDDSELATYHIFYDVDQRSLHCDHSDETDVCRAANCECDADMIMRILNLLDTMSLDNVMPDYETCHSPPARGPNPSGPVVHGGNYDGLSAQSAAAGNSVVYDPNYGGGDQFASSDRFMLPSEAQQPQSTNTQFVSYEYIKGSIDSCCGTFPIVNLFSSATHQCLDGQTGQVEQRHLIKEYQK